MNPITGNNRFARSSSGPDNLVCRFFPGTANHLAYRFLPRRANPHDRACTLVSGELEPKSETMDIKRPNQYGIEERPDFRNGGQVDGFLVIEHAEDFATAFGARATTSKGCSTAHDDPLCANLLFLRHLIESRLLCNPETPSNAV